MNVFKIVLYFVVIFVFTGCVIRHTPVSTISPKITIDKKFIASETIILDGEVQNMYGSKNGLIIVDQEKFLHKLINPISKKIIKELKDDFVLIGAFPKATFAIYSEDNDKTNLECIDSDGKTIWLKELNGKLIGAYEDKNMSNILIAMKKKNIISYSFINKNDGNLKEIDTHSSDSSNISLYLSGKAIFITLGNVLSIYNYQGIKRKNITLKSVNKNKTVKFLDTKNKVYMLTDKSLTEFSSKGKLIYSYVFNININIQKMFVNDNIATIYGYMEDDSKALFKVIDMKTNKIIFEKTFEETVPLTDADYIYNDMLVDDNTVYIINNNKLFSFNLATGIAIQSKELKIKEESYKTIGGVFVYQDKIMIIGRSEIYAYNKNTLSFLWKHDELWTPNRIFTTIRGARARYAAMSGAFHSSLYASTNNLNANSLNMTNTTLPWHLAKITSLNAESIDNMNETIKKSDKKKVFKNSVDIAFMRGYTTNSMHSEYDAIMYLIDLNSGKSKNIQLKPRGSDHCYPSIYVDLDNRTIYQAYETNHFLFLCDTMNQLDIFNY